MQARTTRGRALTCGLMGSLGLIVAWPVAARGQAEWEPAPGPLMTRWAKDVSPEKALPEYPRPQMVRREWRNLNGLWDYCIAPKDSGRPERWDGRILVPFAAESALSGVMKAVGAEKRLWYRREFYVPGTWRQDGQRVLLHFGAVDWEATVFVNGKEVGTHRGGYDPFSFDVTDMLKDGAGAQEIVVSVWDPTDAGMGARGKQVSEPGGVWYTAVTGIWQTVWMEPAPATYIESLRIVPDVDAGSVSVTVSAHGPQADATVRMVVFDPNEPKKTLAKAEGVANKGMVTKIDKPRLWTPDSPTLYTIAVRLVGGQRSNENDDVVSYFGMRKISLGKDEKGITRMMLNNKFLFQYGPLDQGWWPEGLYTAPTDEALRYDIEVVKKLGCNMIRKHMKIEPDRWYYWCDTLGVLVWQDMPGGDGFVGSDGSDFKRSKESAAQFEGEWTRIIDALRNHPSIVMWTPFNEGYGEYDVPRIVELTRKTDPTRLVDNASGGTDRGVGDVMDAHTYPGPDAPKAEEKRAIVIGEFGGLGLPVEGHVWKREGNWDYRKFADSKALTDAYVELLRRLREEIASPGLSGAVYTQTTDVEVELNGFMTYDRAVIKLDAERAGKAALRLYEPIPRQ